MHSRCTEGLPSQETRLPNIELNHCFHQLHITDWKLHTSSTQPDIIVALSDIPFTPLPHSQKRVNKSLERSSQWLLDSLSPVPLNPEDRPNLLVHLVGGVNPSARRAFSQALTDTLFGPEADQVKPLKALDDAITGYTFDLVPLRKALKRDTEVDNTLVHLVQTSLQPLPFGKPRIANSVRGPQDVLQLISTTGMDLFDSQWAVDLATFGVALDFTFPVPSSQTGPPPSRTRDNGKTDIGHNLYDGKYATDFSRLSTLFLDGRSKSSSKSTNVVVTERRWCPCTACSPTSPRIQLKHSQADEHIPDPSLLPEYQPAHTRAYIHHLLHTHEMSAHSLLTMHNLSVVDRFFADIRDVLERDGVDKFTEEVQRFRDWYDDDEVVGDATRGSDEVGKIEIVGGVMGTEAKNDWASVDKARGKGRLAREKGKAGTAVLEVV